MLQKLNTNRRYFASLVAISTIFFLPAYKTGMVTDFLGWILKYETGSYVDVLNCFGYNGLHQFFHFINYSIYLVLGTNEFLWSLLFVLGHAGVAYLMYLAIKKIEFDFKLPSADAVAYLAPLFFLISPYQFEVLTWKACLHYILVSGMFLFQLILLSSLLRNRNVNKLTVLLLLFLASLFTLELSLIFPVIFFVYVLLYNGINKSKLYHNQLYLIVPVFLLVFLYFSMNKIFLGDWVGHYGPERHFDLSIFKLFSHCAKYFIKYVLLANLNPFELRSLLYSPAESLLSLSLIVLILASLGGYLLYKWIKGSGKHTAILFSFLGFFLALAPVISLFFYKDMTNENDRYSYFASLFFYYFILRLIYLCPAILRLILLVVIISFHLYFGLTMRNYAINAGKAYHALIENFPENTKGEIWVLTMPDNFAGLYMFRDWTTNGTTIREAADLVVKKPLDDNIKMILQYNMMNPGDTFKVDWLDESTLSTSIGQYGTWFWRKGIGATSYETEDYIVVMGEWSYKLKIKNLDPNRMYIYQDGHHWKVVEPYANN
jgi:hypothetical protein